MYECLYVRKQWHHNVLTSIEAGQYIVHLHGYSSWLSWAVDNLHSLTSLRCLGSFCLWFIV